MNAINTLRLAANAWLLAVALAGCASTPPPEQQPSAGPTEASEACRDISGTYRASSGAHLLPFFLFGVLDTESPDWNALVQFTRQLRAEPDDAIVTIRSPDPDRLEVLVTVHGRPSAQQILSRSRSSTVAADWIGQGERSFRCERDAVAIAGTQVVDWDEYLLSDAEKKRRYRRPGKNDVGTARGIYRFSVAADGSLVMHPDIYFCLGGCKPATDGRWEPVRATRPAANGGQPTAR